MRFLIWVGRCLVILFIVLFSLVVTSCFYIGIGRKTLSVKRVILSFNEEFDRVAMHGVRTNRDGFIFTDVIPLSEY